MFVRKVDDLIGSDKEMKRTDGGKSLRSVRICAAHVDEILALGPAPKTVWMQLGIHHGPSAQRLRQAGIEVIQDRCIMVDHRRWLDGGP